MVRLDTYRRQRVPYFAERRPPHRRFVIRDENVVQKCRFVRVVYHYIIYYRKNSEYNFFFLASRLLSSTIDYCRRFSLESSRVTANAFSMYVVKTNLF